VAQLEPFDDRVSRALEIQQLVLVFKRPNLHPAPAFDDRQIRSELFDEIEA
jgi:hypothetical protein